MSEFKVRAGKVELAVSVRGQSGVPVVFLHGLSANRMCFQYIEDALHERYKLTTITYDLRGRGNSDKPEGIYGPGVHAEDLRALLNSPRMKRIAKKPVLIAHSLGAYSALEFASRYPESVRGIVLLDGGGTLTRMQALRVYVLLRLSFIRLGRRFPSEDAYLNLVKRSPLVKKWTPQLEALLRYDMVKDDRGFGLNLPVHVVESELNAAGGSLSLRNTIRMAMKRPAGFAPPDLSRIACPVLLIRASRRNLFPGDSILPAGAQKVLAEKLKLCERAEIPANHYSIVLEDQPELNARVVEFLKRYAVSPARIQKKKRPGSSGRKTQALSASRTRASRS